MRLRPAHEDHVSSLLQFFYTIEEYWVFLDIQEAAPPTAGKIVFNGAATGAYVGEPGKGKVVKAAKVIAVQAESAAEAIKGARVTYPSMNTAQAFAKLKSELNETV